MKQLNFFSIFLPALLLLLLTIGDSPMPNIPATDETPYCGTTHLHESYLDANPEAADAQKAFDKAWKEYAQQGPVKADYTLPIVFHVIHNNGPENLPAAVVQTALDNLNDAFENIGYYDQGTGINTQIEFCLATQDPDGNFTTGINYVQSPLTNLNSDTEDLQLKDLIRWDPTSYINVWVVGEICNFNGCGVAGYAYFPSAHGTDVDGIVMEAAYLGSTESNTAVLVHEMGHYLGLYHTFQGGCTNNDCLQDGDQICDTPPDQTTAWVPCNSPVNSCSTDANSGFPSDQNDLFNNYMDYSDLICYNAFTSDQTDRMAFSINNPRISLLSSQGCSDPCFSPITASFTADATNINVGTTVNFSNASVGATTYEWLINGVPFSSSTNSSYLFNTEGSFLIELVVSNADPNCFDVFSLTIEVSCLVIADFSASSTDVPPGTVVFFTNFSQNATTYEWYLDGILQTTTVGFNYLFNTNGTFDVQLVASDGFCSDTSAINVITVSPNGQAQTGLPVWPMTAFGGSGVLTVDWTDDPPAVNTVVNATFAATGSTGAAFDGCADLVFYVAHTGTSNQDELNIYAPDGTELLSSNTANGPGLNAVRSGQEIQVIRVPGIANEWYIIYNEWASDSGAPLNNAAYRACRLMYSRVRLTGTLLEVLERDILLPAGGGIDYTYNDGMAVSRTVNGNPDAHYLYATRRAENSNVLSLDRFIIDQNTITWDANTGNVNSSYWNLTHAGSHVELSPTEDRIAICNRNQFNGYQDYYIFDAIAFNNTNVTPIIASNLILVADGTANDQSSVLPYSAAVSTVAGDGSLPLQFLGNFSRKLQDLEFSPNGRFLYIANGGYGAGGFTNMTYLAQIDLEASPYEVRIQIQAPPNGVYNTFSGLGCQSGDAACLAAWNAVNGIESSYDGNLYFRKRNFNGLYVIPDPNNVMPQNLVPSDIDLSTPGEPNIITEDPPANFPDQIDGYNYFLSRFTEVELVVDAIDCNGDCRPDYPLEILLGNNVVANYLIDSCPDTIYFCADTTQVYQLYDPGFDISYDSAITFGTTNYPAGTDYFNFSELDDCTEICGNNIDDDNDGLVDCDDPDIQNDCCCLIATDVLDLGPDQEVCENGVFSFNAGSGYTSYLWQDFSSDSVFTAYLPGTYWVEVVDSCGNIFGDTVVVSQIPFSDLDLGPDLSFCAGSAPIQVQATGFDSYTWTPATYLSCSDCPDPVITPLADISYIVVASTSDGCYSVDTLEITFGDTTFMALDTAICNGAVFQYNGIDLVPGDVMPFVFTNTAGCDSTILVSVGLNGSNNSAITIDTFACEGDVLVYNGVPINAGDTFEFSYQNQAGCDSIVTVVVEELFEQNTSEDYILCPGETIIINGVPVSAPITLATTFTGANGCDSTHTVTVDFHPEITLDLQATPSCAGAMDGSILATPGGGQPPFTYDWSQPGLSGNAVEELAPGAYTLTVTDSAGCTMEESISVDELTEPVYTVFSSDVDCIGDTNGQIEISDFSNDLMFSLDGASFGTDSLFSDLPAGIYEVYIQDVFGCVYVEELFIDAPDPLLINLPPDTVIQLGTSILVQSQVFTLDSLSYQWNPVINLDCGICPDVVAGPLESTEYFLTVTDEAGCETRESIFIEVLKARLIYIPNGFSPDGDGINDLFYPFAGPGVLEILDFKVFDRWGGLMFADSGFLPNDPKHGWDGTFRGQNMGTGVYTYFVEVLFEDGEQSVYKGGVQLIR